MDLDLGALLWFSSLFFLSYSPQSTCCLVGISSEGFEHFFSCHCVWCIGLLSPRRFVDVKIVSLLLLGHWTLDGVVVILGASNSVVDACPKLSGVKAPDSVLKDSDSGR